ncbi:hypothetical protein D9M71_642200 [compost metagenome]
MLVAASMPALPAAWRIWKSPVSYCLEKASTALTTRVRVCALWSARYRLMGATLQSGSTRSDDALARALFITYWSRENSAHFGLPSLRARMPKRMAP